MEPHTVILGKTLRRKQTEGKRCTTGKIET